MEKIYYKPDEIWKFIQQNPDYGLKIVAENETCQIGVLIESECSSFLVVTNHMEPIEEEITDELQCELLAEELYEDYLRDDKLYDIEDRENELTDYTEEFLIGVMSKVYFAPDKKQNELVEKIKDRFLEILYKEFQLEPYRPMILVDEDGEETYSEYPYKFLC